MYCLYHRNKKKLSSGPPDHTHQQRDDSIPPDPSGSVAEAASESGEDEGVATRKSGRGKGKARSKRKATKVSYSNCCSTLSVCYRSTTFTYPPRARVGKGRPMKRYVDYNVWNMVHFRAHLLPLVKEEEEEA